MKRISFLLLTIFCIVSSVGHIVAQNVQSLEMPRLATQKPEQILQREVYTVSYNNKTKCPNWVAWKLTSEMLNGTASRKGVPYYDENGNVAGVGRLSDNMVNGPYMTDPEAMKPRQEGSDYRDGNPLRMSHGHLCPAADAKVSKAAMNQTFLLSNMCPQDRALNQNDWEYLESRCRGWAKQYGEIYIACGPVFYDDKPIVTMGRNKVRVPDAFFKVVLYNGKKPKALGFIYPNNGESHPLSYYVTTVDKVEETTGIDFFYNLPDNIEDLVESQADLGRW